jgi:predicted AAA+ superfamily ATPase
MIERRARDAVEAGLRLEAAVVLTGPRQVGKTTLALEFAERRPSIYLDLENEEDRRALVSPTLFFDSAADKLVILDEIHRTPELFQTLRGVIDRRRREGRGTGRFLILGSASIDLLRQSGESLAGRVAYVEMTPFTAIEISNNRAERERLWLRGGFPRSLLAETDIESLSIRRNLIRTYLERDIPEFGPRIPATTMDRLWTMLAHRQGSPLNGAELGRSLEISTQSVLRYIDLLVDLLLVRRLPPYSSNVGKRLVKTPKVYIRDSGLLHALLEIGTIEQLVKHPVIGTSWEGFVIETLLSVLPWRANAFFYRTARGAEIDLIIEFGDRSLWAIEIKRSAGPQVTRGFHEARADLQPVRSFVVFEGRDRFPLGQGVEAIGLVDLANELLALSQF